MNIFQRNPKKVVFFAVACASMASIFVRAIEADPIAIGFFRLTFSLPVFGAMVLLRHREELRAVARKDLLLSLLTGVVLAAHFFGYFTAIKNTTIASATVLTAISPVIIMALVWVFFRERTDGRAVVGVLIALIGAVIISSGDYSLSRQAIYGDLMALSSAFFFAIYYIAGQRVRARVNAAVYIFLIFSSCWATFAVAMAVKGIPVLGYSTKTYLLLVGITIVAQIGGHSLFNWCLGYVKPLFISSAELLEPVIATIVALFLFAEVPAVWQLAGGAVTILGLVVYTRFETN